MKLDRLRNREGKLWLNVGSSHYPIEDFVNLDNHIVLMALERPLLLPLIPRRNRNMVEAYKEARTKATFLRHDCRKPLPFDDGTVDHILCSHFLEHVYPDEARTIMADFKRALKLNGTMHLIVPDLGAIVDTYVSARAAGDAEAADELVRHSLLSTPRRGTMKYRALEIAGGFGLQHRWMYDVSSMGVRIAELGFSMIEPSETPSRCYRLNDGSVHVAARKAI